MRPPQRDAGVWLVTASVLVDVAGYMRRYSRIAALLTSGAERYAASWLPALGEMAAQWY